MTKYSLQYRPNPVYKSIFKHLDTQVHLGTVKVLQPVVTSMGYLEDTGYVWVIVPKHLRKDKRVIPALHDLFCRDGCNHHYDCCGCESVMVNVTNKGKGRFLVQTFAYRNFWPRKLVSTHFAFFKNPKFSQNFGPLESRC